MAVNPTIDRLKDKFLAKKFLSQKEIQTLITEYEKLEATYLGAGGNKTGSNNNEQIKQLETELERRRAENEEFRAKLAAIDAILWDDTLELDEEPEDSDGYDGTE